jgi:hypothetical protein
MWNHVICIYVTTCLVDSSQYEWNVDGYDSEKQGINTVYNDYRELGAYAGPNSYSIEERREG